MKSLIYIYDIKGRQSYLIFITFSYLGAFVIETINNHKINISNMNIG